MAPECCLTQEQTPASSKGASFRDVKLKLSMNAKKNRIYPELDVGDTVKILRKRKPNEKERVGNFTQNRYTIERIDKKLGQQYFYVEGNDRAYLRHELLKV